MIVAPRDLRRVESRNLGATVTSSGDSLNPCEFSYGFLAASGCMGSVTAGCVTSMTVTLTPPEMAALERENTYPLRAAAILDPGLFSHEIICKEVTERTHVVRGIPTYYVQVLSGIFEEVEVVKEGEEFFEGDFDVTARLDIGQEADPGFAIKTIHVVRTKINALFIPSSNVFDPNVHTEKLFIISFFQKLISYNKLYCP